MERRNPTHRIAGAVLLLAVFGLAGPRVATAGDAKAEPKKATPAANTHGTAGHAHTGDEAAAIEAARAQAIRDGWPDTPAGMVASGWVTTFDQGEKEMRAFLETHLNQKRLEERPMKARIESYHALRERFGDLVLHSVVESAPEELTVVLLSEDASPHRFVFTVEKESPYKLLQVGIIQSGHGHGHGHGGHSPK